MPSYAERVLSGISASVRSGAFGERARDVLDRIGAVVAPEASTPPILNPPSPTPRPTPPPPRMDMRWILAAAAVVAVAVIVRR